MMGLVELERVVVKRDRLLVEVSVARGAQRYTTPEIAARACAIRPQLPHHACVNDRGPTFGSVMARTSIPHLLEHIVIDLQTERSARPDAVFTGTTRWTDEAHGHARVEVSFESDLAALRALRDALALVNGLAG
ncbi:cyanophycin synthetase family protein [Curtanaerobium respiraculi]|jgi:hypothetical protein|uniref:cyanophycin synthetase family protein n=1 Tax=Curtanaerobium respiraculi TaxID=2949669 RepID=UPI0024B3C502|nr:hypothetical protein [Curtanaerobium respiraculi]